MTTPNRPPLWKVMEDAYDRAPLPLTAAAWDDLGRHFMAAEIRALRDWLVPEEAPPLGPAGKQNRRLRALLTAEADRAERGND